MAAPASYGWNLALITPVPHAGTCEVPAPDIHDNVDQESAELAVDGDVIPEDQFDIVFDIPNYKVTVTNLTGVTWQEQSNVYVSAQRTGLSGEALEDMSAQLDDHEARISALETAAPPAARR
jgi:hypothetical protein